MGPVVVTCEGCGVRIRIARPEAALGRSCPRCGAPLVAALTGSLKPAAESDRLELPIAIEPDETADATPRADAASAPARSWLQTSAALVLAVPALLLALWVAWGQAPQPKPPAPPATSPPLALRPLDPAASRADRPEARPDGAAAVAVTSGALELAESETELQADETSDAEEDDRPDKLAQRGVSASEARPGDPSAPPPPAPARQASRPADAGTSPAPPILTSGGDARRVRIRTKTGEVVVARVYGHSDGQTSVLLPDGQIGFTSGMAQTDEPFRPATFEKMRADLTSSGRFARFQVKQSAHYLVLYQSTPEFADASIKLLERLYKGLSDAFRKRDLPVHDAEFPLVAIIFRTERDFRAYQTVDPEVQAYYEILSNRIYFFQHSERDQQSPEIAALRKPQTVAHEGTHQILQNIGIHPRLADWPLWLVEGLAEYCSPPTMTKRGAAWGGMGLVNPLHMATIHDLDDPASLVVKGAERPRLGRERGQPLVEYLVTRKELSPTDYALSWALSHYLAMKKGTAFLAFLRTMSQIPPLVDRTPADQLAAFRAAFGNDLAKMDKAIATYLAKLKYDPLPYYAVMFEQPIGRNQVRRGTIVTQSPSMVQQWLAETTAPNGGAATWDIVPHPTKARAMLTAQEWMNSH